LPSSAEVGAPRFVGRDDELRCVTEALGRFPAVVLVQGEAGIGKSRLVREALAVVGAGGSRWLIAVCPPFREGLTLGPIVDAARQAVPDGGDLGGLGLSALAGALRPLFPEWADSLPAAPEPLDDAGAARHRLMRAFAELLDRLGVRVLVVEDIHWADDATLEFLLFLASQQPPPCSLVLTCRPEEVAADSLLLRLSSRVPTGMGISHARIVLGGLAASGTSELVGSMLGGDPVSAALTSFLHESTGGVPLVLEECVRLLLDRADLVRRDGEWVQRTLAEVVVPPTIRDAITERVARLGADAQRVLLAAAVLAEPADERALGLVGALAAGRRTESAAAEATASGLLVEDRSHPGRLAFRHWLAARAIYDQAPVPERRAAHRRAAVLLETVRPRPVGRLAHHFRQADEIGRWREYAEQATDVALASGDHHRALALLHELITEPGLPADAVAPLVQKMPFHAFIDDAKRAEIIAALRAVLETDRLSAHDRAQVRGQLGRVFFSLGDYIAAAAEWELAIPDLGAGTFADAWAMIMLGWPSAGPWPVANHRRWLERGWQLAEGLPLAPHQRMILLVNRASVLLGLGQESGWALAREFAADESTPQLAHERARGELNLGDAALRWGRYDEARRRLTSAAEIAGRHGYQVVRAAALVTLLRLDYLAGAWPGLAERAQEWADAAEEPVGRLEALLVGAQLRLSAAGDDQEAEDTLRAVQEECVRRGIIAQWLESAAARAQLRLSAGDAAGALAVTEDGIGLVMDKGIWLWATQIAPVRVTALTGAGRAAEAERLVNEFEDGVRGRRMPAPQAALHECQAALIEGRGEFAAAAGAWDQAAHAWSQLSRPHDAARALAASGRCSRAARGNRPSGRRGYGERLSPRELEVVRLMLDGMTNRQIARELSKSPDTVAAQLKSAMRKYGVTSRTALAVTVTQAEARIV
jgi:DNA-binding CsgD family transcriptional regulator/tetratricopeptide (TPR) repeat protein